MTKHPAPRKITTCQKHGMVEHSWRKNARLTLGGHWRCLECFREWSRASHHKCDGVKPMSENRDCSSWLGVFIAERALSKFFDHIEKMPINNPGYDFICGKGFKIDVKASCLRKPKEQKNTRWEFHTEQNETANYFLLLAFDSRSNLEPQHIWLVPANIARELKGSIRISNIPTAIKKWEHFERPLDKVATCCNEMKMGVRA